MIDWDQLLSRPHMQCALSGQPIGHGCDFYSLLRYQDGQFRRADILASEWNEDLAAGAVSWWRQQRAQAVEEHGPRLLSPEILFAIFTDCARAPERPRQCMAWLLAWLLVRLRFLRYQDMIQRDGADYLVVQCRGTGKSPSQNKRLLQIRDPKMEADEEALLQQQLDELFTNSGPQIEQTDEDSEAAESKGAESKTQPDPAPKHHDDQAQPD